MESANNKLHFELYFSLISKGTKSNMASGGNGGRLSNKQICALADIITPGDLETIAMDISHVRLTDIKKENTMVPKQ